MEVSSIGLDQDRVAGVEFDVALFTNLTRDHLDYHGTMQRYREAKARLFALGIARARGGERRRRFRRARWRARIRRPGLKVIGYGFGRARGARARCTWRGRDLVTGPQGVSFDGQNAVGQRADHERRCSAATTPPTCSATLAVLLASGVTLARRGRRARARGSRCPAACSASAAATQPLVVVDYAHTPDALENVLAHVARSHPAPITESPITSRALTCVFGCGGERDRGKRPQMGRIAARLADRVIVTRDNPRGEDPQRIIADILEGVAAAATSSPSSRIAGARCATPWRARSRGDIVLVAGKGHEAYQVIAGVRHPFSDALEARRALAEVAR